MEYVAVQFQEGIYVSVDLDILGFTVKQVRTTILYSSKGLFLNRWDPIECSAIKFPIN